MRHSFRLLVFLISSLLTVSCGNFRKEKHTSQSEAGTQSEKTTLDFATIKREILTPRCISCHTGRHAAYENYSVVRTSATAILARVKSTNPSRRMPKGQAPLSQDLIDKLSEWVNAGAPELASSQDSSQDKGENNIQYSFADIKDVVFRPNQCLRCHSEYDDYEPTKRQVGSILSLVLNDRMPYPKGKGQSAVPVTKDQKEMLMAWVSQGAPQFVGLDLPLPEVQVEPNYISLRNNVLGPKCIKCHNSYGKRGPTSMETYKDLKAWFAKDPNLFDFSSPIDSHFIGSILGRVDDDELFFDPMPLNSSFDDVGDIEAVSEKNIEIIKKWIELQIPEK